MSRDLHLAAAVFALVAGATTLTATAAEALVTITPAVTYTSLGFYTDGRPFTLGYKFHLSAPVTLNALGYLSVDLAKSQQVGLWTGSGALVVEATFQPADAAADGYTWEPITSTTLAAGDYTIAGSSVTTSTPHNPVGVATIPDFTWITSEQQYGAGLNYPHSGSDNGFYGTDSFLLVDFSVQAAGPPPVIPPVIPPVSPPAAVPEPATWTMMLAGFGCLGGVVRRRRRGTAGSERPAAV